MEDFIDWDGGDCPFGPYAPVEVFLRNGNTHVRQAGFYRWEHWNEGSDVVKYRLCFDKPLEFYFESFKK